MDGPRPSSAGMGGRTGALPDLAPGSSPSTGHLYPLNYFYDKPVSKRRCFPTSVGHPTKSVEPKEEITGTPIYSQPVRSPEAWTCDLK